MEHSPPSAAPANTPVGRVIGVCVGLALLVGAITLAFAWPSSDIGPNELPIAVVGPPEAADQIQTRLDAVEPDGFDVTAAADVDAAETMIKEREVYAALATTPDGVTLYTASAASPMVARLLTGIAEQMAAQSGGPGAALTVEDLVPMPADDPNGAGLAASAFPLAVGGIVIAALIGLTVRGSGRQVAAAIIAPLGVGATVAAILMYVLESVDGDFLSIAGALSFTMGATAWAILGLLKLLGRAGLAIGAVTVMLVGNPLSGMSGAPELLPAPWGEFGQFLTPGAGATLLRSTAYFDGHGAATAIGVLSTWAVAGVVLFTIGAVRAKVGAVGADDREAVPA
ncbi:hypothetical protein K3N28_22410 [Glycomyces sp. TRM65418]|uniref:hypothetical protein n=1 Tax=Glycomyces sp. TRM65418 TaxID=2867006 RepID=UPI001CE55800|nr:hypothetical protein [Glycomyces sp. TRM65418]MCC3765816.1 hypothetical protein [Glycomyces sp. TRM65418]QZD55402.1 hypothetical protein K3N28_22290 [Glycomyces sp. TRM65418]